MERTNRLNEAAVGDSSANGPQSKEVALKKLHKMEWMRNTQDAWHLARPNSRSGGVHERKKYNKDEDNYFEGTGVQKTKKLRRPRQSEGSTPVVPPGFSAAALASPAPQVNAWTQKKGSELFQKDELDEEDQVMKLVLQESLKSAEEDEKRRLERLKMANIDIPTSSQALCAEKDWEDGYGKEDVNENHGIEEDSFKELHFVETDIEEESPIANQRYKSIPPRSRKISPREKSPTPPKNQIIASLEPGSKVLLHTKKPNCSRNGRNGASSCEPESESNNFFEPSRPQMEYCGPIEKKNEKKSQLPTYSSTNMMPGKNLKNNDNYSDDLTRNLDLNLTFGDTKSLFEEIQEEKELKFTGNIQGSKNDPLSSLVAPDRNLGINSSNPSEPSETDILLHSFIRHEPPSNINLLVQSNMSDMSTAKQSGPSDLITQPTSSAFSLQNLNYAQFHVSQQMANTEQYPIVNDLVGSAVPGAIHPSNSRESSSSASASPMQNVTPIGSLEKEFPPGIRTGVHVTSQLGNVSYPYPSTLEHQEGLTRYLQAIQQINQNMASTLNTEFSTVPTSVRGMLPQGVQPQYHLPNSNVMVPTPGHSISPLVLQHQLQQAHLQQYQMSPEYMSQVLNTTQLQQSHISNQLSESDDSITDDQVNHSPIQTSNHLLAQNLQNQMSQIPQNQISQIPQNPMSQAPANHIFSQGPHRPVLPQASQSPVSSQAQSQLFSQNYARMMSQNQPNVLQLQNHPQMVSMLNHPQSVPLGEASTPKQQEILQQNMMLGGKAQPTGKTKEELQIEYQNTLENLKRLHEEMKMKEVEGEAAMPVVQAPPAWGFVSPSPTVPFNSVNQFFPVGLMPQVHPHLIQQSQNTSLMTPTTIQQTLPMSEINIAQEPIQSSVGRGRGRLY